TRARATVQKQHWPAPRIADLLPVHHVTARERQIAGLERSDLGEQVTTWHYVDGIGGDAATEQGSTRCKDFGLASERCPGLPQSRSRHSPRMASTHFLRRGWRSCTAQSRCRRGTRLHCWLVGCGHHTAVSWLMARALCSRWACCCSVVRSTALRCTSSTLVL